MSSLSIVEEHHELPAPQRDVAEKFVALFIATNTAHPDRGQLTQLREMLIDCPELGEIVINLNRLMEDRLIEKLLPTDASREALSAVLRAMRIDLGYAAAPALERALIELLLLCWLRLQDVQHRYQSHLERQHTFTEGLYWEKRLSSAHTRYLKAVESLGRLRRLATRSPTLMQVNIGISQ